MLTELLQQGIDSGGFLLIQGTFSKKNIFIWRYFNGANPQGTKVTPLLSCFDRLCQIFWATSPEDVDQRSASQVFD